MSCHSYAQLVEALKDAGLAGQLMSPHQMAVSTQPGPVWPNNGNSFWLSLHNGAWFLVTWAPVGYRIPADRDVVKVCVACMNAVGSAMAQLPSTIVNGFGLTQLSDAELIGLPPFAAEAGSK